MANRITINKILKLHGWRKISLGKNYKAYRGIYRDLICEISNMSNMYGKGWNIHIDNDRAETVGCADVDTFEDIDLIIDIYNDRTGEQLFDNDYINTKHITFHDKFDDAEYGETIESFGWYENDVTGSIMATMTSNTVGCKYHVIIDNKDCDSILSMDIRTVEQFNKLIEYANSVQN